MPTGEPDVRIECDDVLIAVGQENAFPWIERDIGVEFDRGGMPKLDQVTFQSSLPYVFFGGDSAFGPKNIITAVAHGHEAAISIDAFCRGEDVRDRPPPMTNLVSQKMGIHEWCYDNDVALDLRFKVPLKDKAIALKNIKHEVELGFDPALAFAEAQRCLNCDVQTVFSAPLCIECDACVDICPIDCITFTDNGEESELRLRLKRAGAQSLAGHLRLATAQDRPHHGQGRGPLPALRPLRRALSDRRLGHAEIHARHGASGAHGMPIQSVNDFVVRFANVNGSGSASANLLFARVDPAHGRADRAAQHLPLQHPGPADLVRGARHRARPSGRARRHRPDGGDEPADLRQGRRRRSSRAAISSTIPRGRSRPRKLRDDIIVIGMPLTEICTREYTDPRQRQLFKNIVYVGALAGAARHRYRRGREADRASSSRARRS